jgi:hypothetical protein
VTDFLAPIGPPQDIHDPASRDLIAALYEHDWYTEEPRDGSATVVSPDRTRVMVIEVSIPGDRLVAYIDGERKLLRRAIDYVRGE